MPTLSEFSARIRQTNVHRPYLYYVEIVLPLSMQATKDEQDTLNLYCHSAQTPQLQIYTDDDYMESGIRRKLIYEYDYQNPVLSFYVDQNFVTKKIFDRWKQMMISNRRNFQWQTDYLSSQMIVHIVDIAGKETYSYTYKNVYPKSVHSVDLNYQSVGQPTTFAVEFVFETVLTSSDAVPPDVAENAREMKRLSSLGNKEVAQGLNSLKQINEQILDTKSGIWNNISDANTRVQSGVAALQSGIGSIFGGNQSA